MRIPSTGRAVARRTKGAATKSCRSSAAATKEASQLPLHATPQHFTLAGGMLIACGFWHSAVQTHPLFIDRIDPGAAMTQGHREIVTCVAATDDGSIVVTGSRDCTCTVWNLSSGRSDVRDEYAALFSVYYMTEYLANLIYI